jgi:hypothetical protein
MPGLSEYLAGLQEEWTSGCARANREKEKLMARKNSAQSRCAHVLISFVTIFAVSGAMDANNTSTTKPAIANYARPLNFEPNRGQTNKQVDFLPHGAEYSLFLSHAEAVMVLQRGAPANADSHRHSSAKVMPSLRSSRPPVMHSSIPVISAGTTVVISLLALGTSAMPSRCVRTGEAYVTGSTQSIDFPTKNAVQPHASWRC